MPILSRILEHAMARVDDAEAGERLKSSEGFIARAYDQGGLKAAVREAERLLKGIGSREALEAAATMAPKVRTAVMKMVNLRRD